MKNSIDNTKKVIVVIVEGVSDKVSFEGYLNMLSKDKSVFFSVYRGDLTTDYTESEKTVNEILIDLIKECSEESNFEIKDVAMVIQITDTDGVFAKDVVEQDLTLLDNDSTLYFQDKIVTRDVLKYIETQSFKKERILDCLHLSEIEIDMTQKIPFEIYYMSCNLECALHNKYNTTDDEKSELSEEFAIKYPEEKMDDFIQFMHSINASGTLEFKQSWEYIKKGNNSLKPCSNFIIFLLKLYTK